MTIGLGSADGQSLPFPIDFDGRPYNTLTLACERVIYYRPTTATSATNIKSHFPGGQQDMRFTLEFPDYIYQRQRPTERYFFLSFTFLRHGTRYPSTSELLHPWSLLNGCSRHTCLKYRFSHSLHDITFLAF